MKTKTKWNENWDEFVRKITPIKWHEKPLEEFDEKRNEIQRILQERRIWIHAIYIEKIDEYDNCFEVTFKPVSLQIDKKSVK